MSDIKEGVINIEEEAYPELLREIQNPPKRLYYRGDISLLNGYTCVAMVGARKATEYGRFVAGKMAGRLAESGIVVVSGMATGIDSYSHMGALEAGGKTIAVLGNSVEICFPSGAHRLKKQIEEEGLVLSEYPPGTHASKGTFPQRNRIISGLSQATVVVEAGLKSGSLITAELAIEQGRSVYAVPGNITGFMSIGTNKLIKDGAGIVTVIDDVLSDLASMGLAKKISGPSKVMKQLGEDEKIIYNCILENGETDLENLAFRTEMEPGKVTSVLTILEMKGIISTDFGKIFLAK